MLQSSACTAEEGSGWVPPGARAGVDVAEMIKTYWRKQGSAQGANEPRTGPNTSSWPCRVAPRRCAASPPRALPPPLPRAQAPRRSRASPRRQAAPPAVPRRRKLRLGTRVPGLRKPHSARSSGITPQRRNALGRVASHECGTGQASLGGPQSISHRRWISAQPPCCGRRRSHPSDGDRPLQTEALLQGGKCPPLGGF